MVLCYMIYCYVPIFQGLLEEFVGGGGGKLGASFWQWGDGAGAGVYSRGGIQGYYRGGSFRAEEDLRG